jgi:hypothetical protein
MCMYVYMYVITCTHMFECMIAKSQYVYVCVCVFV